MEKEGEDGPLGVASTLFQYSMDFWAGRGQRVLRVGWEKGVPSIEASAGGGAAAIVCGWGLDGPSRW